MKEFNAKIEHRCEAKPAPGLYVRCSIISARCSYFLICVISILALASTSRADDPGITVSGTATIKAKPTEIDIVGIVTGEGELANDASVKFHDSRKKALAAIENLKNPDLSVNSDGSDVHDSMDPQQQMRMMQGQTTDTPKTRTQISERLKITLKNVDKLESDKLLETVLKLLDTSRDAGLAIGTPPATNYYQYQMQQQNGGAGDPLVQFKIPDTTDLQTRATKQAIENARTKAQQIADLSGVKLGRIRSVNSLSVTDTAPGGNMNGNDHPIEKEAVSSTIGDIPITVHLSVQFEIEKASPDK